MKQSPDIFTRAFWKAKPGPVFRLSRWCHFLLAFGVATGCGLFGYDRLGWSAAAFVLFFAWEAATPVLGGSHPWGDVIDFLAFVVGWGAGASLALASYAVRAPGAM